MARVFAASIEQLKQLQATYCSLIGETQFVQYDQPPGLHSRALTPILFGLPKPRIRCSVLHFADAARARPRLSQYRKYLISRECAELRNKRGSSASPHPTSVPTSPPTDSVHVGTGHSYADLQVDLARFSQPARCEAYRGCNQGLSVTCRALIITSCRSPLIS
ncbi:hypothetical protein FOMPIDRAFT_1050665 [Fomitopsis schrenkii]|uniref:Uncharacterized protein n=1 Tax=Fomitopsis schrenkii TaxID=2126942 RepID=S8E3L5_FOMSC|nr:hypothetical protein FOMPIDRAFT_1050665 [Fomitopsis schrenkii]